MARILVLLLGLLLAGTALAAGPDVDELLFAGADAQYRGDLGSAAASFEKALAADPGNEFALNQLGLIRAKTERFDEAAKLFDRVIAAAPDNTYARVMRAVLFLREGQVAKAMEQLTETVRLDPANANAWYFMGVVYLVEHNLQEAVACLRKAQAAGSDDPETHYRLGLAFSGLDMSANARLEFERALALNPKHTKALTALGWVLFNAGEREPALESWKKVLEVNPQDAEAQLSLAKVLNDEAYAAYQAGKPDAAKALWTETLRFEPKNKAAEYYLGRLKKK
jgi:tetratricopeptide (TPR) repeat protein